MNRSYYLPLKQLAGIKGFHRVYWSIAPNEVFTTFHKQETPDSKWEIVPNSMLRVSAAGMVMKGQLVVSTVAPYNGEGEAP